MVTLGLAFILENGFQIVFGPGTKSIPPFVEGVITIGDITLSWYKLSMLVISLLLVGTLEYFLAYTRYGQAVRAVSQDMQGAKQVGIDVNRVFAVTFGLSVVLAGIAGILLAPIFLVSPLGGWGPFLKAFVIVVLGGLGQHQGCLRCSVPARHRRGARYILPWAKLVNARVARHSSCGPDGPAEGAVRRLGELRW